MRIMRITRIMIIMRTMRIMRITRICYHLMVMGVLGALYKMQWYDKCEEWWSNDRQTGSSFPAFPPTERRTDRLVFPAFPACSTSNDQPPIMMTKEAKEYLSSPSDQWVPPCCRYTRLTITEAFQGGLGSSEIYWSLLRQWLRVGWDLLEFI